MLLDWIFSFSPIAVILILMVRYRWGAERAGPAGWLAAVAVGILRFGVGMDLLALAQVKALLLTVDVLMIVWAAFLLFRVADEAGAIEDIGRALPRLTADRGMQALLIAWAFASFLQGVGGFGVPVAVTAPLLVGLGFSPLAAVIIPSLGHGWAVTFGSLASSFQALMAATNLPGSFLAPQAAIMLGLLGLGCGLVVVHAADRWQGVRRLALPVLVLALVMGATQYLLVTNGLWNIGGFGAGMAGLAAGVLLARRFRGSHQGAETDGIGFGKICIALSGYLALITITLGVQLITPLKSFLSQVAIRVPFPAMRTALGYITPAGYGREIFPLRHAGAILMYASLIAYLIYLAARRYPRGAAAKIIKGTLGRVLSSSLGIVTMVSMAVVMAHAGMTDMLAQGLAQGVSEGFGLVSPWIGALGAFITGSNTNSNVIFAYLQMRTGELLGYSVAWILAAQTAGGAIGSVVAPTKVVVGASTAGMAGNEGAVMRGMLKYVALLLAGLSLATWILV